MNMTRIIRNTVYQVKVYNDRQDEISMEDAILRLILNQPTLPPGAPGPDSRPRKGDRLRAHQWHPNKSPYLSRIEDLPSKCEATGSNPVWRAKSPLKSVFQWAFFALLRRY